VHTERRLAGNALARRIAELEAAKVSGDPRVKYYEMSPHRPAADPDEKRSSEVDLTVTYVEQQAVPGAAEAYVVWGPAEPGKTDSVVTTILDASEVLRLAEDGEKWADEFRSEWMSIRDGWSPDGRVTHGHAISDTDMTSYSDRTHESGFARVVWREIWVQNDGS
jgi:hypothetical protein